MENNEKKWGIYPGLINPIVMNSISEIDVWKKIDNLGAVMFWTRHDADKPWVEPMTEKDLIEAQYTLEYLVYYTRHFGVEFSYEPRNTIHVERSESYNAWYLFWKNHFDSMDPDTYNKFVDDKFNCKDISKYMPEISWKESYQKIKK